MSKDPLIADLITWSTQNGCSCDPRVQIYSDPITGLSFKAANFIPPGTEFMKCSFRATLSYLNALEQYPSFDIHDSPRFPRSFITVLQDEEPYIIGHFFLIQQYLLKEKSYWWPYIRLLPQPDEPKSLAIPAWWPDEDQQYLAGTNAEPAIKKRKKLWKAEWKRGIQLLQGSFDVSIYPLILYQWAASIFGTRSFRASTTLSAVLFREPLITPSHDLLRLRNQIHKDKFSLLLPLVDIGNHNGVENVSWAANPVPGYISLVNSSFIEQGNQIYNYYGDKSNTELLVGYGFIIDQPALDRVNLRVTPPPASVQIRRLQSSHTGDRQAGSPEEEFLYWVKVPAWKRDNYHRLNEIDEFAFGWFDTISCAVANRRERSFLSESPGYSLGNDTAVCRGLMYRNFIAVLQLTIDKLKLEVEEIKEIDNQLPLPTNQNQVIAQIYRQSQSALLKMAIKPVQSLLSSASIYGAIRQPDATAKVGHWMDSPASPLVEGVELLSIESAYDWLARNVPELASSILGMIADSQGEGLPLDWAHIIKEDWDYTYWAVWIFAMSMLHHKNGDSLPLAGLNKWMTYMEECFKLESEKDEAIEIVHAQDDEEIEAEIRHTCLQIFQLPYFAETIERDEIDDADEMHFASWVANEEMVQVDYRMSTGEFAGKLVRQHILCFPGGLPGPMKGGD